MVIKNALLLNKEFTWRTMRALHELRHQGQTKLQVLRGNAYMQDLVTRHLIVRKPRNQQVLLKVAGSGFDAEFDNDIAADYAQAEQFLVKHQLNTSYLNHTLAQLQGLAVLFSNAVLISRSELSRQDISSQYMGGSKVLKKHPMLYRDALKLLGLQAMPVSDHISQTAVYKTGAFRAQVIVLCENESYLKQPAKAQRAGVELLNAGGRNVCKLEKYFVPAADVSLYYACDWDYAGLAIFRTIAAGYRRQGRQIQLLTPVAGAERKAVQSADHFSQWSPRLWDDDLEPDALVKDVFSPPQQQLIADLMAKNEWIEEESSEFVALLNANGVANSAF